MKVVVVSKFPLPNYRFDLDDKRPQREVFSCDFSRNFYIGFNIIAAVFSCFF